MHPIPSGLPTPAPVPPKKGIKSWKVFHIPGAGAILEHTREATL